MNILFGKTTGFIVVDPQHPPLPHPQWQTDRGSPPEFQQPGIDGPRRRRRKIGKDHWPSGLPDPPRAAVLPDLDLPYLPVGHMRDLA